MDLYWNIPPMLSLITPLLSQGQACNKLRSSLIMLNAFSYNLTPRWLQISRQAHSLIEKSSWNSHLDLYLSACWRNNPFQAYQPLPRIRSNPNLLFRGFRKVAIVGNDFETRESFRRPHVYPLNCRSRILSGQYLDSFEMTLNSWKWRDQRDEVISFIGLRGWWNPISPSLISYIR
jgi:hypothetical protein